MSDDDLERRLAETFDATSDAIPDSAPPTFSWQSDHVAHRRLGPRRIAVVASGLVAAAVVAALTLTGLPEHGSPSPSPSDSSGAVAAGAPRLLLDASHVKLANADPVLATGQYRYIRIVSPAPQPATPPPARVEGTTTPRLVSPPAAYTLDEYWIPKDETDVWMRRQHVVGDPNDSEQMVFKGRCDDLYAKTQDGPKGPACTRPGSFDDPTPAFIASLPRDPGGLYRQLRTYARQHLNPDKIDDVGYSMFTTVQGLLDGGVVTGDLTATLYAVLRDIDGINVEPRTANYAGVVGTGFELSTELGHTLKVTSTIIIDLDSGAYLGSREDSAGDHYATAVTVGVADQLGVAGS